MVQRRLIVFRACDAIRAKGAEFESGLGCFSDETVLIGPFPWVGWDLIKGLYPVFGERRYRRAFDEGLETLLGGGVVAGVDFVGAEGGADGLEVAFSWR